MEDKDLVGNVPDKEADWLKISKYSCSFNAYEYWGSFDKVSEIANECNEKYLKNSTLPHSVKILRTCIFFEQRRFHHYGWEPSKEGMVYIRALIDKIRNIAD